MMQNRKLLLSLSVVVGTLALSTGSTLNFYEESLPSSAECALAAAARQRPVTRAVRDVAPQPHTRSWFRAAGVLGGDRTKFARKKSPP